VHTHDFARRRAFVDDAHATVDDVDHGDLVAEVVFMTPACAMFVVIGTLRPYRLSPAMA
jgi:hypothetical protein